MPTEGGGRDEEFSDYVRERRPHLLATAYLLSGDRSAAERLVQTALAKLYVVWDRVHRSGSEDGYARRMLMSGDIDAHPDGPVERLAALAPGPRRVIVLRHWLGLSVEEVALELDISTGAVERQTAEAITEPGLYDRMTEVTAWTRLEPIDPVADVRRGRLQAGRSVVRRRLAMIGAGVLALAVVVAVISLTDESAPDAFEGPPIPTRPERPSAQLASWFADHLDPQRRYIKATDSDGGDTRTGIQATMTWRQGAGAGLVLVSMTPPDNFDATGEPATSKRCQLPGRKPADGPPYTCGWTTAGAHRVLTGTADVSGVRSYFASYVRPDGYLVQAAVEGDRRDKAGTPPVRDLEITLDEVVAAVTDPALKPPG